MQARCQSCQTIFDLPGFGRHRCPGCGTEVEVLDPAVNPYAAPQAAATSGDHVAEPASSDFIPTPWERRAELGTAKALKETVIAVLSSPQRFLQLTDWSKPEGLWSLFFWVAVVPQWIGALLGWFINNPGEQIAQMKTLYASMGQAQMSQALETVEPWIELMTGPAALAAMLVIVPVSAFLTLYATAGLTHLVLMALGRAHGGWNATLKIFVYASSPIVFAVVPSCGILIAMTWSTVLQVLGLAPAHRITVGAALGGVVGMHLVFICVLCGLPTLAFAAMVSAAGGGGF